MEILSLVQDGERLYKKGKLNEAIKKFKCALKTAEKAKESDVRLSNINVCRFNLAAVYAANQEIEKTNRYLGELNIGFLDRVENGRAYEKYLKAIAAKPRNKQDLEEALVFIQECGRRRYILEILVEVNEISRKEKIKVLKKLGKVYSIQQEHLKRMQVMCRRAQLLYLEREEEDSLTVLQEIEREYKLHYGGDDEEIHTTTSKCNTLAHKHEKTHPMKEIVPIWNEVGLLYSELKMTDEAIACFEKGLNLVGKRTSFKGFRATLYQNIGAAWILKSKSEVEYRVALKNTQTAIEINCVMIKELQDTSVTTATRQAKYFLHEGQMCHELQDTSVTTATRQAKYFLYEDQMCHELQDTSVTTATRQAKYFLHEGQMCHVSELQDILVKITTRQAKCFLNEGHIFMKLRERSSACMAFTKASTSGDEESESQAYVALGEIALELSEHDSAKDHLKKALGLTKDECEWERIFEKLLNVHSRCTRSVTGIAYKRNTLMTQRTTCERMSSGMRITQGTQRKTGKAMSSVKTNMSLKYDSTTSGCDTSCSDDSSCCSSSSACCTDCESDSTYSSCYRKKTKTKKQTRETKKKMKDDKKPTGKVTDRTLQNVREKMKLIISETPRKSEDTSDDTDDDDGDNGDDDKVQEKKHTETDDDEKEGEKEYDDDDDDKDAAEKDDDNVDDEKNDDNDDDDDDDDDGDGDDDDDGGGDDDDGGGDDDDDGGDDDGGGGGDDDDGDADDDGGDDDGDDDEGDGGDDDDDDDDGDDDDGDDDEDGGDDEDGESDDDAGDAEKDDHKITYDGSADDQEGDGGENDMKECENRVDSKKKGKGDCQSKAMRDCVVKCSCMHICK